MDLCTGGRKYRGELPHDEIVHDESSCPLCAAMEEIVELKDKIEELEAQIIELEQG